LFSKAIIRIDALRRSATLMEAVPAEAESWIKVRLQTNSAMLNLEMPESDGKPSVLCIDTGDSNGIKLHPERWRAWRASHANQPMTLDAIYTPGVGGVVAEVAWAGEMAFGPLVLTDVPINEPSSAHIAMESGQYAGTLGMAALKRVDLIVDGRNGFAYLRAKTTQADSYRYNRIGAVFLSGRSQSDDLAAVVLEGSPAYAAGIRNGDVLLKIGQLDVTKWRTDPKTAAPATFWELPAGTKLVLTLRRGRKTFKATVQLRDILASNAK
jgi:hypothetical protein